MGSNDAATWHCHFHDFVGTVLVVEVTILHLYHQSFAALAPAENHRERDPHQGSAPQYISSSIRSPHTSRLSRHPASILRSNDLKRDQVNDTGHTARTPILARIMELLESGIALHWEHVAHRSWMMSRLRLIFDCTWLPDLTSSYSIRDLTRQPVAV